MSTDKTLADVQPGGRVRLGDRPKDGEVLVKVLGLTGSGKSAIAGEIEILCKALGLEVEWVNGDEEKRLTHAEWIGALEMYKPKVVIAEQNIPRAALSAQPSPGDQDALDCIGRIEEVIEFRVPHDIYAAVHGELAELKAALAARQPVGLIPAGFVLVPEKFGIPAEVWEGVEFVLGGPGTGEGEAYLDSTAWVGDLIQDDGSAVYGLHLSCDECPEEGSVTLAEFAAPPAQAVDLGQFRAQVAELLRREFDLEVADPEDHRHDEGSGEADRISGKIVALLDSQAVGK